MVDVLTLGWATTLAVGIDASATSCTLAASASGNLSDGDHIIIGSEVIQVGTVSGTSLTGLTRAASPVGHGAGARVTHLISSADVGGGAHTHDHDDLTDVTTDQHHVKSHAHDGVDGSGVVDYGDLTSVPSSFAPSTHATSHQPGGSDAMAVDAIAATGSLRTLGTGAQQAAAGNDSRLSDSRTPTAHATSHENGGSDEIEIVNLGTAETDTTKRLAPNGTGGVAWGTGSTVAALDDLSDVTITTPAAGEVLAYTGAVWINQASPPSDEYLAYYGW